MNKFDQRIIEELSKNARISISHIADSVSLSRSSVSERIKKMEKSGIIRGYQVLLSESQKEGVTVYFEVKHRCARCAKVIHLFKSIPEIVTCHGISGEMDFLVLLTASNMQRIHEVRELLDAEEDIIKIKTHVVMSEWIDNRHV